MSEAKSLHTPNGPRRVVKITASPALLKELGFTTRWQRFVAFCTKHYIAIGLAYILFTIGLGAVIFAVIK